MRQRGVGAITGDPSGLQRGLAGGQLGGQRVIGGGGLAQPLAQRPQRWQRAVRRLQRGQLFDHPVGAGRIVRVQRLPGLDREGVADLVQTVRGHGVAGVGAQHTQVQRASAVGAGQPAGGQRLAGGVHHVHRLHAARAGLGDREIEPVHVLAAAQQLAGQRRARAGLVQVAGVQRGPGLLQFGLTDLAQATAGLIVVRLQCQRRREQFARAGAVLAIQVAGRQGVLGLHQHGVEIGARQHLAQAVLVEPQAAGQQRERQPQPQPAQAVLAPAVRRGGTRRGARRGARPRRCRPAGRRRTPGRGHDDDGRRTLPGFGIHLVEITQHGFDALAISDFVGVAVSAHGMHRRKQPQKLSIAQTGLRSPRRAARPPAAPRSVSRRPAPAAATPGAVSPHMTCGR